MLCLMDILGRKRAKLQAQLDETQKALHEAHVTIIEGQRLFLSALEEASRSRPVAAPTAMFSQNRRKRLEITDGELPETGRD